MLKKSIIILVEFIRAPDFSFVLSLKVPHRLLLYYTKWRIMVEYICMMNFGTFKNSCIVYALYILYANNLAAGGAMHRCANGFTVAVNSEGDREILFLS